MVMEEIYLFLILFLKINYISSYIILPFSFSVKNNTNHKINCLIEPENYFRYYMKNTIYTEIKINEKLVNFKLSMDIFSTFISEQIYQPKNKDRQEIIINKNFSLNYININKAKIFNDSFYFYNIPLNYSGKINELIKFNNFTFFQVNKYEDNSIDKDDSVIGLNRIKGSPYMIITDDFDNIGSKYEEQTNLINQLKNRKIINSEIFSIKYENLKEEGKIIIGDFPHEYDNFNYHEKNLFYNKVTCYTCPPFNYFSRFTELFYNNQSLYVIKTFEISIDHGFIEAPLNVKKYFDSFFEKNNNFCKEININNVYAFYCLKDVIYNFSPIVFYFKKIENYKIGLLNEFKLEFNYKDLFKKENLYKNKEIYYFQIIFKKIENWIFGKPLFKKYMLVFDQKNKMYGIYDNIEKNIEVKNIKSFNKIIILWIIIIIFGFIAILESFFLIKKIFRHPRNKRANELNDEFDYNAQLNNVGDNNFINK